MMLSNEIFKKEMTKLMQSCNYEMVQSGLVMWFNDLKEEGFNNDDFTKGIKVTRRSCGRFFPTLATLVDNCQPHYNARMEKEGYIQKQKDEETAKNLFSRDRDDNPNRQLFLDVNSGRLSKKDAAEKMRELHVEYPKAGWGELAAEYDDQINRRHSRPAQRG
ncbi:hypothetical protein KAR91_51225 [Candidatus Pacearchaeota archaeon]|nr:hypothetical protein [Candidatus Pacearchaeota archaeon]